MAISWHWAFGPETSADLASDYGFAFPNGTTTVDPTSAAGEVYTYAGSPTRYSLGRRDIRDMFLPAAAFPATAQGWVAIPVKDKVSATLQANSRIIQITGAVSGRTIYVDVSSDQKSLRLYVSSTFKESTAPLDWTDWRYVALKFDMTTTTWSSQLYVDGVGTASHTSTTGTVAEVSGSVTLSSAGVSTSPDWLVGQVLCYDSLADVGEVPRFVTRVEPNADGTNIGTWTPSVGTTDYEVLDTPLDVLTYTENTAPTALDRVHLLTNGGGSDLDTALGTVTTAIDSVMVHGYSSGQQLTARVLVGDGVAETGGPNEVLTVGDTSYTYAVANTKPSGGAWVGSDAPELVYEVVS